jgi:ribosome-associated toxin RatA of RatAB toxin-antitoxin module
MRKLFFILIFCSLSAVPSIAGITFLKANGSGGTGQIQFEVNAPLNSVRPILQDDTIFIKFIPGIQKWKVLQNNGPIQVARCTISMSKIIPPMDYTVEMNQVSPDEIRFKRLSGDLKDLKGNWKLSQAASPDKTLVTYRYQIDTGLAYMPKVIVEKELKKHLKETENRAKYQLKQFLAKK